MTSTASATSSGHPDRWSAVGLLIATGIVWAFYSFVVVKCINKYPALTFSFHQTLAGTLFPRPRAALLATMHASDLDELRQKPLWPLLRDSGVFSRAVIIEGTGEERRYRVVELLP